MITLPDEYFDDDMTPEEAHRKVTEMLGFDPDTLDDEAKKKHLLGLLTELEQEMKKKGIWGLGGE